MYRGLGDLDWPKLMERKAVDVWRHTGQCACGRRTFLFARCPKCIQEEAIEALRIELHEALLVVDGEEGDDVMVVD